ncbi:MAG: hypothetical protein F4Y79_17020 [Gemmatimonadetes bacterium]|nr:hypothetical protein [Gemmatimonadota bacterium]MYB59080.1 hypothetical protein [Gemmatimonadota bacterium]
MLPPLVADMNIGIPVIQFLRESGIDIVSSMEQQWGHLSDEQILARAYAMDRFVLTHDSDFGTLAVFSGYPLTGIIYLRPGGRLPSEVIADLGDLLTASVDWTPPMIVVYRSGRLRIRRL